ncbi:MAG: YdcF family protein [Clostridia bacterium]|nr:YdcF family protein [Clostridia bacterium]
MIKHQIAFIIAGGLLGLAAFMKFAMVGYSFLALVLTAIAAAVILFAVLPMPWKTALAVFIALFMVFFSYWEVQIIKAAKSEAPENADYLIVLGCGVRGTTPSIAMKNRTDAAAAYLLKNPDTICICSGGQGPGEDTTEASAMKQLICTCGIDDSRIILEENSTSTEENIKFSADVITEYGGDINNSNIVICSSEYHIFRAKYMAEYMLGVIWEGLPAQSTLPLSCFGYYLREGAGMIAVRLLK